MKSTYGAAIVLACFTQSPVLAQNARSSTPVSMVQSPATGVLPEIEVRPPRTDSPAVPSVEDRSTSNSNAFGSQSQSAASSIPNSGLSRPTPQGETTNRFLSSSLSQQSDRTSVMDSLRATRIGGASLSDPVGLNNMLRSESNLFELPQLTTVVDREKISERQSSTLFRALQNEVGLLLQQTGNGQASPFIRGLTGQQILVLVDGIRMNTSILRAGPNQYTATIDPGMIERIEIVRGAESAMWGSDAIGGAINIVTRSADPRRGDHASPFFTQYYSTAEASSYTRTGFASWSGETGIIGGVSYLDAGLVDRGGSLGRQPATDYEQFAGDVKLQRLLNEDHLITFALQHFEQEDLKRSDRFLPFVLGPAPNGSVPTQRPTFFDPQQRDLGYIRLEGLIDNVTPLADAYSVTLSGMRTKEATVTDRYPNNLSISLPNRREIGEFDNWGLGTIVAASKDLSDYGKITYGSDFYDENIDSVRTQTNNPTNPNSVPFAIDPQYPDDAQADRVGSFLTWNVLLLPRLDMTASVRYENINLSGTPNFNNVGPTNFSRTYQDWIASVGFSHKTTDNMRLIGGVYEGFRAPTLDDLTANKAILQNAQTAPTIGNLNVQPERTLTYEAGFKVDSDRWNIQLVEFWTDFDSYIGRQIINNNEFLVNQEAFINGTELAGEYLLKQDVQLYGNFYYTYGDIITTNDFFPRIPPTQGILGMRFVQPTRRSYFDIFTWMVQRADRYNQANLSDVRFIPGGTPGYATLNVRTGRSFGANNRHQVSLSLENITDKYYRVLGSGVDGAGFNAIFGYQYAY